MQVEHLTTNQITKLTKSIDQPRDQAIIQIILNAGLILNEITTLKKTDINWQESTLTIQGKRQRTITLDTQTFNILAIYDKRRPTNTKSDYFFLPMRKGKDHLTKRNIDKLIRTYATKANLNQKVNTKILRNTFAINLCDQPNMTTKKAMTILGLKNRDNARRYFTK